MASAAFASQGYLNIFVVMSVGALGNILGDISMYSLSRRYGEKVLRWFHLGKLAKSKPIQTVETVEKKYSAMAIIASRFQDQATAIVNVLAGLGKMEFRPFATYAIIGDVLQIMFFSAIGYFFAETWQSLYNTIGVFSWIIVLVTVIISIFIANKVKGRMMR